MGVTILPFNQVGVSYGFGYFLEVACYPVDTAEYSTARDLADDPAFNCWVN